MIIIPMAGEGKRFSDKGYTVSKPAILTFDRRTGIEKPMVVCATLDLPGLLPQGDNVIYVDRDFHRDNGTEKTIKEYFPHAKFITLDYLTEGQACTCMLAAEQCDMEEELLIAGCDNGMEIDADAFQKEKEEADVLVFTYRNNESVLKNPNAYGWMIVDENGYVIDTSIKKTISDNPMNDHAVVATFWFKKVRYFMDATNKMISENDRINNEFYVDQVARHALDLGLNVKVFEIGRYIGWGTPEDYEVYQNTFKYWKKFYDKEKNMFE